MTIAPGFHLFPFRTEKLSPVTPMVLRNSGRVGSRRFFLKDPLATRNTGARGFSRLGGGIGRERRRMGDVRMERGEVLCSVIAQSLSILPFSFPSFFSLFQDERE